MEVFSNNRTRLILLFSGIVLLAGIGLRVYHFHDFLRFNPDQARDAGIVTGMLHGESSFPLLGPKAGGTEFKLGPIFYYFQYGAARIFGNYPDVMAYPDLLASLLALPLLYLLLRRYFHRAYSLIATSLFAISFYAIKYSHFAWNPNSTPFWTMLFLLALGALASNIASKQKWAWAAALGISIGVGIQLHTFLLVMLPIIACIGMVVLIKRRLLSWKHVAFIVLLACILNIPQGLHEWQTGGENIKALFDGASAKNGRNTSIVKNIALDVQCFSKGNVAIMMFVTDSEDCQLFPANKGIWWYGMGSIALCFTIIGMALALVYAQKSETFAERFQIVLVIGYMASGFLIMLPVVNELSMRYFLILAFMPYVLSGFWVRFIREHHIRCSICAAGIAIIAIAYVNIVAIRENFSEWNRYSETPGGSLDIVTLKEMELIADYLVAHAGDDRTVLMKSTKPVLFKTQKALSYLVSLSGKELKVIKDSPDGKYFILEKTSKKETGQSEKQEYVSFGRFSIYQYVR